MAEDRRSLISRSENDYNTRIDQAQPATHHSRLHVLDPVEGVDPQVVVAVAVLQSSPPALKAEYVDEPEGAASEMISPLGATL